MIEVNAGRLVALQRIRVETITANAQEDGQEEDAAR